MVLQTWIFSGSRKVVDQKKRWVYTTNPPFFRLEKSGSTNSDFFFWSTTFLEPEKNSDFAEPLFSNLKKGEFIVSTHLFFYSTTFLEPEKNLSLQNHFSPT